MPDLWTPYSKQMNAQREALTDKQTLEHIQKSKWLTRELREIDPNLDVVFVGERAPSEYPDIVPGRWHIRRRSTEGTLDAYWALTGDDGEYVEPGPWIIEQLKARDLWNARNMKELMDKTRIRQEEAKAKEALQSEQRKFEVARSFEAAKRVSGDGGMTRRRWGAS